MDAREELAIAGECLACANQRGVGFFNVITCYKSIRLYEKSFLRSTLAERASENAEQTIERHHRHNRPIVNRIT